MNGSEWRQGLHPEFLPSSGSGLQLLLRDFSDPSGAHAWIEERLWKGCFRETLGQSLDTGERVKHRTSCDKEFTASQDPEGQRWGTEQDLEVHRSRDLHYSGLCLHSA